MNYAYFLRGFLDRNHRLTSYPAQASKRPIALRWLASQFRHGQEYSEPEVNARLNDLHTFGDAALLRRELYDTGLFDRIADGTRYWKTHVALLPDEWTTERCIVRNGTEQDIDAMHGVVVSCSHLVSVDPTFAPPDREIFEDFVRRSNATSARSADLFRIQPIRTKKGNHIAGYLHVCHAFPHPHTVWISFFVINREMQGMGYGREVVTGLKRELLALNDYSAIWLDVFLENTSALRFWIDMGFRSIDKYKQHRLDDGRTVGSIVICHNLHSDNS